MKRSCDGCTACCEGWLQIDKGPIKATLGRPCPKLSIGVGCSSFENRPEDPCKVFICSWLKDPENFSAEMQPNQSKLIVQEKTIYGFTQSCLTAVACDKIVPESSWLKLKEIADRLKMNAMVLTFDLDINGTFTSQKTLRVHGFSAFQNEMARRFVRNEILF